MNKFKITKLVKCISLISIFTLSTSVYAIDTIEVDKANFSNENIVNYSKFNIQGTSYLTFRDVPTFIEKYANGNKTLDYGCGAGRSTRFLQSLGLDTVGVDISKKFIDEAISIDSQSHYFLIESAKIPVSDNSYDCIFSSHVLLMVPTKDELGTIFKEIHRVLKDNGVFIAVTSSEEMHSPHRKWVSYETDFIENQHFGSGSVVKLLIKGVNAIFYDYNWTNEDYSTLLEDNGFEILETHYPLGKEEDGIEWLSEKDCSPYVMYVVRKVK